MSTTLRSLLILLLLPLLCTSGLAQTGLSGRKQQEPTTEAEQEKKRLTGVYMRAVRSHAYAGQADSANYYATQLKELQLAPPQDTVQIVMTYSWTASNFVTAGYYDEALALLDELEGEFFDHPPLDTLGPLYATLRIIRGDAYSHQGQLDTAMTFYKTALREFGDLKHMFRARAYDNIAGIFERRQLYDSAIYYQQLSVDYGQRYDEPRSQFYGLTNMALIFHKTGRDERALGLAEEALAVKTQADIRVPTTMLSALRQIRCAVRYATGMDSVAHYCHNVYNLATTSYNSPVAAAGAATVLARYHNDLGNPDSVSYYYAKAWEISEDTPVDPDFVQRAVAYSSDLLGRGRGSQAYGVMSKAMERHRALPELNDADLGPLYTGLARTEYTTGRIDSAEAHFATGMTLLENSYQRLSEANVADAAARFEVQQADFALEQERADRAVAEAEATQQRTVLLTILGAAALLLLGALYAYRRVNQDRRRVTEANTKLAAAVAERETLLKEIHHRVKNNLQIISGLLFRQARKSDNVETRELLRDGNDRIKAMALVHQNLYQRDELTGINLKEFANELSHQLQISQLGEGATADIEMDIADTRLDLDRAIPVGLILNELITNTFKYAFGPGGGDRLRVLFRQTDDQARYLLTVTDNGPGLPANYPPEGAKSLGLHLVRGLVRQLRGTCEFTEAAGGGLRVDISFAAAPALA